MREEAESKKDLDPLIRYTAPSPCSVPAPHWKVTHSTEMLHLTTKSKGWRVMLPGSKLDGGPTGNPTCKLRKSGEEDPVHFLATCNALQAERQSMLSHAPLNLPDPAHDPIAFTEVIRLDRRPGGPSIPHSVYH